ncbi:MAG: LamG-like jellyroll fold domain-containing protein [Mangrovibacterium sp.]
MNAIDNNLILYLPFDDPDGLGKVYDFSKSQDHGIVTDAYLTKDGVNSGKAMVLKGEGDCNVSQAIPFASDFTLSFFVRPYFGSIGYLINFEGIDNYIEHWLDVEPREWIHLAFVKMDGTLYIYRDGLQIYSKVLSEAMIGLSLNDTMHTDETGFADIDELKLFDRAYTQPEILKLGVWACDVEYLVNGKNFKEFGVYVKKSDGLVGLLKMKSPVMDDHTSDAVHGHAVTLNRPRYEARTITLECFIEAPGKASFVNWMNLFLEEFCGSGTKRFEVNFYSSVKPILFEVYLPDGVNPEKQWNDDLMVGTFTIVLVEPDPVKKVLKWISATTNSTAFVTVTTNKPINISWGDGSVSKKVSGTNKTVTHTYEATGEYNIIMSGVIEDITAFDTNAIIVWTKI